MTGSIYPSWLIAMGLSLKVSLDSWKTVPQLSTSFLPDKLDLKSRDVQEMSHLFNAFSLLQSSFHSLLLCLLILIMIYCIYIFWHCFVCKLSGEYLLASGYINSVCHPLHNLLRKILPGPALSLDRMRQAHQAADAEGQGTVARCCQAGLCMPHYVHS